MISVFDFYKSLPSPVKAWLKEQLLHLKSYEARVQELKAGIQDLKKARDAVQHKVDEEENRYNRGILGEVKEWIAAVNTAISEFEKFDEDEDHKLAVFDLFTSGYLPRTGIRYRLSRKAYDITRKVNGLLQTANHDPLSYWLGPPSMSAFFQTVGYESFPSRDETMKKIKVALKNPSVRVIGLHGLSGVGKTTLVKQIAKESLQASEAGKVFDVVTMANVTRNPNIRKIQGQIADMLGMKLDEESDIARAAQIRKRLTKEKESALIILDDLWAALDLNMLGIPLESDDDDGEHNWMKTTKDIPSGNVKEGKIPGEHSMTEAINENPSGNVKERKTLRKNSMPKTVKEIPHGNVNEGKAPREPSMTKAERNNGALNMMESKKLLGASSMKTEETLSHYKGCKVFLISESKQVLLSQMEGNENSIYFVEVLKEKEGETLFKKMAEIGDKNSEFEKLAAQIANKCNGLPMSIVTTARALKNQSRSVWEDVHRQLERGKFTGASEFSTKLSYDLLEDEELKYTFLLCACMGPDALIMDLVKYCVGLGFLQGIYTVKEARNRVYALVGKLKLSGLLSDSYASDHFTMQDIVRGAALSIASKEKHVFTMMKGKIDEWPDKLDRYAAISLHYCHIIEGFPRRINYPRLRLFHVNSNDPHLEIPKNFFKGMKELRVLILTGFRIAPLDSSIASLTELRMLSLEQCLLDRELSIIGELKKLRILSFSGSDITKLPVELKQLKKLQIFDISNCSKLGEIPSNVISSLISLEELYMRNTLIQWEVNEQTDQSKNASISELRQLNHLTTLDIQILNAAHLPKNLFFDKLYSYKIVIGDLNTYSEMDFKIPEKYEASRFLAIQLKDGLDIHSQKSIKMLFERVEHLILEDLNGVKDIFYRLNLKGFPYLKHLLVVNNSNIQSLINPKERRHPEKAFPKLQSLYLNNLMNLDKICCCTLSAPSFGKLKVIKINLCRKLKNVFLINVVSLLTVLETIEVSECYALEEIVEVEAQNNSKEIEFPELRSLTLQSLSDQFIGFYPISSTRGDLFNRKVMVSKLERMKLSSIQIEKIWTDQPLPTSCFQNLLHLDVNGCQKLMHLISFSMAKSLVNLQSLFVCECEKMTHIFLQGQSSHTKMKDSIFPNLKNIKLSSMKSLREIWDSELPLKSFGKLDTLIIEECDKFVNVFPCYMEGIFQSLCNLRVTNCKSMKAVFELDDKKRDDGDVTNLQDVYLETLPKLEHVWKWSKDRDGILKLNNLQKMRVHDCDSLENIFPVSVARCLHNLQYFVIWNCFGLREIVARGEGTDTNSSNPDLPFVFPKLATIKFSNLPKLVCFYPEAYELSCPALNNLSIELCDRLDPFRKESTDAQRRPTLFSEEVINKLKSLQIESWHAKSSSSCMGEGNRRQDNLEELCLSRLMNPEILYSFLHNNPNLKNLSLNNCSLPDIVPLIMPPEIENLGVVPKLKSLKLIDLPNLETIGFERDIILERIEFLILKNCPRLVNIMASSVSLTHLTNLEVVNCDGLEKLMPLSAARSLVQLNSMKVIKCESIMEIVKNEEENAGKVDIVFKQMKVLELVSLKNLNCFSKSCVFEFPSLEKLIVSACPKMENFSKDVKNAPLLQKIYVVHEKEEKRWFWKDDLKTTVQEIFKEKKFFEGMDEVSLSEHCELQQAWHGDVDLKSNWFYSLKTLKLEDCENLSYAIPSNILPYLKSLKELEVRNCNQLKVIFAKNDPEAISSQLKNLTLEGLSELEHVWEKNCQGNLRFQNLQQVFVSDCESLKTLFPAALAKNLKKLEKLEIKSCQNLLEIIGKEEDVAADGAEKFMFPCLTSLDLYDLPELTYFYPEIFTMECPELHILQVLDCPKLELFLSARPAGEGEGSGTSINKQPLFSDIKAISVIEELSIDWKHSSVLRSRSQQLTEDLKFLKEIRMFFDVDDNDKPTLPFDILEKAPNLQGMSIEWCDSLDIFCTQDPKISEHGILGQLKVLTLNRVFELQHIGLEDSWLNTVYEKLHELNVSDCPDLTKLFHSPPTVSFSNLKELYINECHGLEYLFTSSVAKVLTHLEEITVKESQSIKEIMAKEQDGRDLQGIKFESLYCIDLDSLSSLECFYSGNDTLQLPSLTQVDIWQCPKMEVFSRGELNAKSFRGIQASSDSNDELVFHNDLNASVKRVFLLQMLSEGVDEMSFSKHPKLQEIWHVGLGLQNNWFYSLKTLKLHNCDSKSYAIPSNILPYLKCLKELEVRECNNVKVIFNMNDTEIMETAFQLNKLTLQKLSELTLVWEKNCQGILRFQNLQQVSVRGCNSMQTLFPAALAQNLTMLEKLEIQSCDELREIIAKDEHAAIGMTKKFVFPRLTLLYLSSLRELTCFYPGIFTVECPKLNKLSVRGCPKLELFQGSHPEGEGESQSSSTSINRLPLFPDLRAISILEELFLDWKHTSELRLGQHTEDLKYLNKIKMIFADDKNEKATLPLEILEKAPNLQCMTLVWINSLEVFLTQIPKISEHGILGQLKTLALTTVYKLQCIDLEDSWLNTVWDKLHRLHVAMCPGLTKLFRSPSAVSFSYLKVLYINACHGLKYLFTSSVAKVLMHLRKITVKESHAIKVIVAEEQEGTALQGIKFERLYYVDLGSLPSLESFYSGSDPLHLPSLRQVEIQQCPKMEVFSRGEISAKSFRGVHASFDSNDDIVFYNNDLNGSLEKLFVLQQDHIVFGDSPLLKAIWLKSETVPDWCFCNLNSLVIEGCEFLSDAILPSHLLPFLSNLKTLEVRKCNSVKSIFVYTKIGPQGSLSLPFLEKLCVENCEKLLEIVAKDETATEEANKEIIMFPRVTYLMLYNLNNLRCIYPGMHILQWPMLTELYVMHCPKLKFFATEFQSSRDSFPTNQQAVVSLEKVTPRLGVLTLCKEEAKLIEQGNLHVDLQQLSSLILQCFHDKTDVFPFVFGSKALLPSTICLGVYHSDFKEIFPSQTPHIDYTKILSQLEKLELDSLPLLKSIGLEHSWMGPFLKNLKALYVRDCGSGLTNLTPSTVSFSNLIKLEVKNCHGLKYLFTSSTAKTLRVLRQLRLANCKLLKAIVAKEGDEDEDEGEGEGEDEDEGEEEDDEDDDEDEDDDKGEGEGDGEDEDENENENEDEDDDEEEDEGEGEGEGEDEDEDEDQGEGENEGEGEGEGEGEDEDENEGEGEDEIIFKKLEILKLSSLPKLGSFYSGSPTLKFPSLKRVSFTQCYNTKVFCLGDVVPKDVQVTKDGDCPEVDINSVIMQQFEEEMQPADLVS